ncbi:hypothetical protein [Streptococcus thoraltensis]|uniref:hypothetical protein n=1 Tax=Streptococcus thoraltensis TaxID=55085 RepID=UPI001F5A619F|nr:hypothetical protein [Streptococcus thoraltensis]
MTLETPYKQINLYDLLELQGLLNAADSLKAIIANGDYPESFRAESANELEKIAHLYKDAVKAFKAKYGD